MTEKFKSKNKSKHSLDDSVPTFIRKTYEILEETKFPDIIDWNEEGTALVIKKTTEFCQKVLPLYFKHNNLTSFIRQLNMYNFHKRRTQEMDHVYCHELFQRGKKYLLKDIKRKNNEHYLSMQKTVDVLESIQNSQDNSNLIHENQLLNKLNKEILLKYASMERKMKETQSQNQALWNQIYSLNEREEILKHVLTNLMKQFNVLPAQLPVLMKNYPPLATNKQDYNYFSQNQVNYSFNNQDCFYSLPTSFLETSSTETSGDELKTFPQEASQENEPKKEVSTPLQNYKYSNYDPEFFRTYVSTDSKGNNGVYDFLETKTQGLLSKRPLDLENGDKTTLELVKRELSEGIFVKRNVSNLDDDTSKLGNEFRPFKRDEFDLNPTIDLMNFNIS